jgi:hypothetical protein
MQGIRALPPSRLEGQVSVRSRIAFAVILVGGAVAAMLALPADRALGAHECRAAYDSAATHADSQTVDGRVVLADNRGTSRTTCGELRRMNPQWGRP